MQPYFFASAAPELERGPLTSAASSAYPVQYNLGAAETGTMPKRTAGLWIAGVGTVALGVGFAIGVTVRWAR